MIRFFRKIRQKLVAESQFSKYLIYALGEIILVVLGILIALQVNNWNIADKEEEQEINYLNSVLKECETNKKNLQLGAKFCERILSSINYINKSMESDLEDINMDSLNTCLGNTMLFVTTTYIQDTYKEMQSSGALSLISSDSIKDQMTRINSFYEQFRRIEDDSWHLHYSLVYAPFTAKHLDMQVAGRHWAKYAHPSYQFKPLDSENFEFWSLPKNHALKLEFANILQLSYGAIFYSKISAESLVEMTNSLETMTKKELESR